MIHQHDLFGSELPLPKDKNELNEICCEACYTAREEKCTCKCHGAYHGLGNHESQGDGVSDDFYLSPEESAPFTKQLDPKQAMCCGLSLMDEPVMAYGPHSGGWTVEGYDEPLWLFIKCPKCRYDWSLWKLGVKRERV